MLRITRETDYGIVLMTTLAQSVAIGRNRQAEAFSASGPSRANVNCRCRWSSKILKALTQAGLLVSQRGGAYGGYSLAQPAAEISVVAIIEALEGPIAITECSNDDCAVMCLSVTLCA